MPYNIRHKIGHTFITSAHQGFVQEGMRSNTLSAYWLAARRGADMIETDARASSDGVLMVNHDPTVKGFDESGRPVEYDIATTPSDVLRKVILARDSYGVQYMPTLEQTLSLCYRTGMQINIDLKNGVAQAELTARMVCAFGMRGRCVYATNAAGAETIRRILSIDPLARFIDTPVNYTEENLRPIQDYRSRCFAYTNDFSSENISRIRESGCMLAAISLTEDTIRNALPHHPEMLEYPHTSDFLSITENIIDESPFI